MDLVIIGVMILIMGILGIGMVVLTENDDEEI
jgi:hypothetical protein